MTLSVNSLVNIYGKNVNLDAVKITRETEKAFFFETTDSFGSHLHDYDVSFWLPKSVAAKNCKEGCRGEYPTITLPFWYSLNMKKQKI